jgi:hypothetical protein
MQAILEFFELTGEFDSDFHSLKADEQEIVEQAIEDRF